MEFGGGHACMIRDAGATSAIWLAKITDEDQVGDFSIYVFGSVIAKMNFSQRLFSIHAVW